MERQDVQLGDGDGISRRVHGSGQAPCMVGELSNEGLLPLVYLCFLWNSIRDMLLYTRKEKGA